MSILHNSKALDIGYFVCRFGEWRHLPVAPARSVEPLQMRRWLPTVAPCPGRLPRQDCSPWHAHALPLGQPPPHLSALHCSGWPGEVCARASGAAAGPKVQPADVLGLAHSHVDQAQSAELLCACAGVARRSTAAFAWCVCVCV